MRSICSAACARRRCDGMPNSDTRMFFQRLPEPPETLALVGGAATGIEDACACSMVAKDVHPCEVMGPWPAHVLGRRAVGTLYSVPDEIAGGEVCFSQGGKKSRPARCTTSPMASANRSAIIAIQ